MESAAQLPTVVVASGAAAALLLVYLVLRRVRHLSARFVVLALTIRYLVSAFHQITYDPLVGGLSIVALVSAIVFVAGIALLPPRRLMLKALAPLYALLGAITISALINPDVGGLVDVIVKWGYFLVILLHAREAAASLGAGKFSALLLCAFVAPLVFQLLSLALGVSKATDADGSVSYIGGYNHEAAFSIIALTALMLAGFASVLRGWSVVIVTIALASIMLANYRTVLIAAAPFLLCWLVSSATMRVARRERPFVAAAVGIVALAAGIGAVALMQERFADFAALWGRELPHGPTAFTDAERDLFSSRLYLWSQYLDGFARGSDLQWMFGQGPEAWTTRFVTYAHNTAISTLYEYGLVGLLCLIWFWVSGLVMSARVADRAAAWRLIGAHLSIIVLNMSTMGQWLVEGLMLYALVYAYTMVLSRAPALAPARAPAPMMRARRVDDAVSQN